MQAEHARNPGRRRVVRALGVLELDQRRARRHLREAARELMQQRARQPRGVLARPLEQARRALEHDVDLPAACAQAVRRAGLAGVGGQQVRVQPGALHRLEQPQRALLPARDGRVGQQRRDDGGRDRSSQAAHAANMPAVRILVCASEAPRAPLNGSRLVLHELLPRLAQRAELTVLALRRPGQDRPGARPASSCSSCALPDPAPARAWAMRGAALALQRAGRGAPAGGAVQPRAAEAARGAALRRRARDARLARAGSSSAACPALIAPLDAWHLNVRAEVARAQGVERWWRRAQESAVRHWEATAYRPFARVVLVTEEDAREVAALDPSLHVVTIPNGVDADHFTPRNAPRGDGILFTGALDAPSNEQAALRLANRIMPLVRREIPDAHLTIAGRNPGPAVRALEHVVADVPDLRPYLWGAAVYACPMESGTGIKNKLLEAMAAGAPAVATLARLPGHRRPPRRSSPTATPSSPPGSSRCSRIRERAGKQADAARAYVRARHDWDAVAAAYLALYQDIA